MKVGTKVNFRFAGTKETGIVESKSTKSDKYLVRGIDDDYLYPLDKSDLIKNKK